VSIAAIIAANAAVTAANAAIAASHAGASDRDVPPLRMPAEWERHDATWIG